MKFKSLFVAITLLLSVSAMANIDTAVQVSGLDKAMQSQPVDLMNLKATLMTAGRNDAEAKEIISDVANAYLPSDPHDREDELYNLQMILTFLASQYGYQEMDK